MYDYSDSIKPEKFVCFIINRQVYKLFTSYIIALIITEITQISLNGFFLLIPIYSFLFILIPNVYDIFLYILNRKQLMLNKGLHSLDKADEILRFPIFRVENFNYADYYWREAIFYFKEYIKLDTRDPIGYYYVGLTYSNLIKGCGDERNREARLAIENFDKTIDLEPEKDLLAQTYHWRAIAYEHFKDYEEMINNFKKYIDIYPNEQLGYYNLGITYSKMGSKYKLKSYKLKAYKCLRKVIEMDENSKISRKSKEMIRDFNLILPPLSSKYKKSKNNDK